MSEELNIKDYNHFQKVNMLYYLLEYDSYFKNELSDCNVNDIIEMYEFTDFTALNYSDEVIKDFVKKGIKESVITFQKVFKGGKLIKLIPIDGANIIRLFDGDKSELVWKNLTTNDIYPDSEILNICFVFRFNYLLNKFHKLYLNGKRPNISEHMKQLKRIHIINKLISETI